MDKLNILEHQITVLFQDQTFWNTGSMGRASLKDSKIGINPTMTPEVQASTLLHEIIHIIADALSLEVKEPVIDGIAMGLFQVLRRNPELVPFLLGAKEIERQGVGETSESDDMQMLREFAKVAEKSRGEREKERQRTSPMPPNWPPMLPSPLDPSYKVTCEDQRPLKPLRDLWPTREELLGPFISERYSGEGLADSVAPVPARP